MLVYMTAVTVDQHSDIRNSLDIMAWLRRSLTNTTRANIPQLRIVNNLKYITEDMDTLNT